MNLTILTLVGQDTPIASTLTSVLESNIKPENYCLVLSSAISEETKSKVLTLFKTCCGNKAEEIVQDNAKIYKTILNGINIICVQSDSSDRKDLIKLAIEHTKDITSDYLVLDQGLYFSEKAIELFKDKLANPAIGLVYSDYYKNNLYMYLPNFHVMMKNKPVVKSYAIRSVHSDLLYNENYFDIASTLYNVSVISKIPEAVVSV